MGWSDISISLSGPIVSSLAIHFVDRWLVCSLSPWDLMAVQNDG
jgi:phosphatidylserine/phosphatidylglycerophosphate/cardiolipin synthase-like enzyme